MEPVHSDAGVSGRLRERMLSFDRISVTQDCKLEFRSLKVGNRRAT
jgi:hypothetical protein